MNDVLSLSAAICCDVTAAICLSIHRHGWHPITDNACRNSVAAASVLVLCEINREWTSVLMAVPPGTGDLYSPNRQRHPRDAQLWTADYVKHACIFRRTLRYVRVCPLSHVTTPSSTLSPACHASLVRWISYLKWCSSYISAQSMTSDNALPCRRDNESVRNQRMKTNDWRCRRRR